MFTFTHCLKKRTINGRARWVCRKSTKRLYCLNRRPHTHQEDLEKESIKSERVQLGLQRGIEGDSFVEVVARDSSFNRRDN